MAKLPTDIRTMARAHTEDAVRVLVSIMNDPSAPLRVRGQAATYLLAHGLGGVRSFTKMVPDNRQYYVYSVQRHGRLIYIGKGLGSRRFESAKRLNGISRLRAVFATELEALRFERRLIRRFRPLENFQHARAG